jgi:hypothetical protein
MTRRPNSWRGTEMFWLVSSAESSDIILNSGIPDKSIYTYKWFCQPECSQSKPNTFSGGLLFFILYRWFIHFIVWICRYFQRIRASRNHGSCSGLHLQVLYAISIFYIVYVYMYRQYSLYWICMTVFVIKCSRKKKKKKGKRKRRRLR